MYYEVQDTMIPQILTGTVHSVNHINQSGAFFSTSYQSRVFFFFSLCQSNAVISSCSQSGAFRFSSPVTVTCHLYFPSSQSAAAFSSICSPLDDMAHSFSLATSHACRFSQIADLDPFLMVMVILEVCQPITCVFPLQTNHMLHFSYSG